MHCLRFLRLLGASVVLLASIARAEDAAPAETTKMLADLRAKLEHSFSSGSWQGRIITTESGCAIQGSKGADGKGDIGQTMQPLIDLSGVKYIEVALGIAPKNEVPAITIAFNDADDVQYTAGLRIDQLVPGQPVWLRVKLSDFKLNDWKGDKAGKKINWAKIKQWHLQGDWNTEAPCHIIFIALRTRH